MGIFKIIRNTNDGLEYMNNALNYALCGHTDFDKRYSLNTDIDNAYSTVAEADNAYEAEKKPKENIKCLKYIALKNAENGAMFYDTNRNKVVVKVNGKWHDVQTSEVPDGTYNF